MRSAAFFDLDKTILAKSSSFAFARPFYRNGLIGRADVLRSAYAQLLFRTSGADHDQMETMRDYMSQLITGWEVDKVKRIITETLEEVVTPMVFQEAIDLFAEHRAAGRDIIIISSSGIDMVAPIGDMLGADRSIGTEVGVLNGRYTGEITFYAYGPGKADAMLTIAADEGYDLAASYAYSDSITDVPMLELVGYPSAVNPDDQLRRIAVERGWPILDFARPVALRRAIEPKRAAVAAGAGVALVSLAVGIAWVVRRRLAKQLSQATS
jgi:HAD superfamily hydrolase (TIGR01490 family)